VWVCSGCDVDCRIPLLVPLVLQRLRRNTFAFEVAWIIAEFLGNVDWTRRRRLKFLENVLRSPGSPFQQFTYFNNGIWGNISMTEDILDRILSFV